MVFPWNRPLSANLKLIPDAFSPFHWLCFFLGWGVYIIFGRRSQSMAWMLVQLSSSALFYRMFNCRCEIPGLENPSSWQIYSIWLQAFGPMETWVPTCLFQSTSNVLTTPAVQPAVHAVAQADVPLKECKHAQMVTSGRYGTCQHK